MQVLFQSAQPLYENRSGSRSVPLTNGFGFRKAQKITALDSEHCFKDTCNKAFLRLFAHGRNDPYPDLGGSKNIRNKGEKYEILRQAEARKFKTQT